MSETQTYYVIMIDNEYMSNPDMATTKYICQAMFFMNIDAASWFVSVHYRHGMPAMNIKAVKITVEDDNESLS
jgi:hypothetical protein